MTSKRGDIKPPGTSRYLLRLIVVSQVLSLTVGPFLALAAAAQGTQGFSAGSITGSTGSLSGTAGSGFVAQAPPPRADTPTTILPTDVVPLPAAQERLSFGENLQLRLLQRLPARLYFNTSVESSFRYETNVFQFPTRRKLISQILAQTPPPIFTRLPATTQRQLNDQLQLASANDVVFRVLPNVSIGWTITPRTRVFGNYFLIRDSLFHNIRLNTVIQSVAFGIQQDIPVTRRGNLQIEMQARELYQQRQQPQFDFLPALTFSYILTPRTVGFVNTLLQLRGKRYFQAPTKEIDPFYTFGFLHQRGGWSFSSTATLVQNFREPFRGNATIPVNNYSWILDFEVARRIIKPLPGLQAFFRFEPIYNFHSNNRPGLAGQDFRFFWGMRFAMGKPALTAALEQIRQQLEEQEGAPPPAAPPGKGPAEPKPSAFLMPYQLIAATPQPIHGYLSPVLTHAAGDGQQPPVLAVFHPGLSEDNVISGRPDVPPPLVASGGSEAAPLPVLSLKPWPAATEDEQGLKAAGSPAQSLQAGKLQAPARKIAHKVGKTSAGKKVERAHAPRQVAAAPSERAHRRMSETKRAAVELALPAPESALASMQNRAAGSQPASAPAQVPPPAQGDSNIVAAVPKGSIEPVLRGPIAMPAGKQKHSRRRTEPVRSGSGSAQARRRGSDVQMILVPPLPSVNPNSKDNPFANSGVDVSRPIMLNVVR